MRPARSKRSRTSDLHDRFGYRWNAARLFSAMRPITAVLLGLPLLLLGCAVTTEDPPADEDDAILISARKPCDDPKTLGTYEKLLSTTRYTSNDKQLDNWVTKIQENKSRYRAIEASTGYPRLLVAAIHAKESSLDFAANMVNGEPLHRVTRKKPEGLGPWKSWEAAAETAMNLLKGKGLTAKVDSSLSTAQIACLLEYYNGLGYRNKGVNSPYLWAGTNHYERGRFVERSFLFFGPYVSWDPNTPVRTPGAIPLINASTKTGFHLD
jgi:lysozyme family protein